MSPQTLMPTLGDRLVKARRIARISQRQAAEALNISLRSITRYEDDATEPNIDVLRRWATLCGVPFSWLAIGELPPETGEDTGSVTRGYPGQLSFDDAAEQVEGRRSIAA